VRTNGGDVAPPRVEHQRAVILRMTCSSAEPRTVSGSRMRRWRGTAVGVGLHTVLPSAGKARSGRHWAEEFAKDHTFIHYDERGSGLSDWTMSRSRRFVRSRSGSGCRRACLDRFALLGISKVARPRLPMRRRHPERVSQLVLYGALRRAGGRGGERIQVEMHRR